MRLMNDEVPEQPTQSGYDLVVAQRDSAEQGWREALKEIARLKKVIADRDDELEKAHEERFTQPG
jgi:hypothetical protein